MPSLNDQLGTRIERLAKLYEKKAEAAFLSAIAESKRRGDFATVMNEIAQGNVPYLQGSVTEKLMNVKSGQEELAIVARDAFAGGAKATSKLVSPFIGYEFDPMLPDAVHAAKQFAGRMVTGVNKTTRATIRHMVMDAFAEGLAPYQLAEQLKNVVGLSAPLARAVKAYKNGLTSSGVNNTRANRMARDYARSLLNYRAKNIARTEMMTAVNEGQHAYWKQARDAGFLREEGIHRVWIATVPSERTCPICSSLDGKTAPVGGMFEGGYAKPPAHPQCRCTVGLTILKEV